MTSTTVPEQVIADLVRAGEAVRADEVIIEAVLELLAEGATVEALSIEAVANRAGVGKATIYRRWPNKEVLVVDAIAALNGPLPEITGESVRDDLLRLLRSMGSVYRTRAGNIMPRLIPELQRNAELARCYQKLAEPHRELMREVLHRGISSGQLRADLDVEVTIALLVAPMVAQSVPNWHPGLDMSKLPEQIVDGILPGILPPVHADPGPGGSGTVSGATGTPVRTSRSARDPR